MWANKWSMMTSLDIDDDDDDLQITEVVSRCSTYPSVQAKVNDPDALCCTDVDDNNEYDYGDGDDGGGDGDE